MFGTQYFKAFWTHARVISILKPGNDLALPSSYRTISLLDTIGKLFVKILSRILYEVCGSGLHRDKHFGLRPKNSTALQLVRLVDGVYRIFDEKRLKGSLFFILAKAFDTVCVEASRTNSQSLIFLRT